jgi:ABC-type taurine transport system ATPase subunit
VEAGLPELQGQRDFIMLIASELKAAGLLAADLAGMVSPQGMMQRLTTDFGRRFVRFISPPQAD